MCIMDDLTWLLAAFPMIRFLVAKETQALNGNSNKLGSSAKDYWQILIKNVSQGSLGMSNKLGQ